MSERIRALDPGSFGGSEPSPGEAGAGSAAGSGAQPAPASENTPVDPTARPDLDPLLGLLRDSAGSSLSGVVHFGSQVSGASPGRASAHDLVVVVTDYGEFYRATKEAIPLPGSRTLARVLNRFLAPNILRLRSPGPASAPETPAGPGAKLFVVSERDLARSIRHGTDHFFRGRLMQRVSIVHAAGADERSRLTALLDENRRRTLSWVGPFLEGTFSAARFAERLLQVSYRGEIRPESSERVHEVFEVQREFLTETFVPILDAAVREGLLVRDGAGYRLARRAGLRARAAARLYFLRSKLRATLRWLKYLLTFDDWAGYVTAKLERRTGTVIEVDERERRFPLLFLWPKLWRALRSRDRGAKS